MQTRLGGRTTKRKRTDHAVYDSLISGFAADAKKYRVAHKLRAGLVCHMPTVG